MTCVVVVFVFLLFFFSQRVSMVLFFSHTLLMNKVLGREVGDRTLLCVLKKEGKMGENENLERVRLRPLCCRTGFFKRVIVLS
jgi:hypothetical protein